MLRLHERQGDRVDVASYFEFAALDIIGDLTFGESFECLQKAEMHVSYSCRPEINF